MVDGGGGQEMGLKSGRPVKEGSVSSKREGMKTWKKKKKAATIGTDRQEQTWERFQGLVVRTWWFGCRVCERKGNLERFPVFWFQHLVDGVTSIEMGGNEEDQVFRGRWGPQLWICWTPGNTQWTAGQIGLEVRRSWYWRLKLKPICIWLVVEDMGKKNLPRENE